MDKGDGHHPFYQDYSTATDTVIAEGLDEVPQKGAEVSSTIKSFSDEQLEYADAQGVGDSLRRVSANNRGYQVEDGIPPNNAPFTEGDQFPTSPADKDYHRLTYTAISDDLPARLHRYSTAKGRWIFMEKDRRSTINSALPVVQEFLNSPNKKSFRDVTREDDC